MPEAPKILPLKPKAAAPPRASTTARGYGHAHRRQRARLIAERPVCERCGGPSVYFLAFDATCCPSCNTWLEIRCQDPDCLHCQCRPERPLP